MTAPPACRTTSASLGPGRGDNRVDRASVGPAFLSRPGSFAPPPEAARRLSWSWAANRPGRNSRRRHSPCDSHRHDGRSSARTRRSSAADSRSGRGDTGVWPTPDEAPPRAPQTISAPSGISPCTLDSMLRSGTTYPGPAMTAAIVPTLSTPWKLARCTVLPVRGFSCTAYSDSSGRKSPCSKRIADRPASTSSNRVGGGPPSRMTPQTSGAHHALRKARRSRPTRERLG